MEWLLVTLIPWVYAAYTDHTQRMAPNFVWAILLLLGVCGIAFLGQSIVGVVVAIVVLAPTSWYLYRQGMIAGADSKALYVLPVVYGTLSFPMLLLSVVFAIPWIKYRDTEYAVPLLIPLAAGVTTVVLASLLF
jgi:Flp pilus assembly protein protease CpaA